MRLIGKAGLMRSGGEILAFNIESNGKRLVFWGLRAPSGRLAGAP